MGRSFFKWPSIGSVFVLISINGYQKAMAEGEDMDLFMKKLNFGSRDNGRTPMQWDSSTNSGFTSGIPWLPANPNFKTINVQAENSDPESVLNHFRNMTKLRKENPVLVYGGYELLSPEHSAIYAYTRSLGNEKWLVLLNFSDSSSSIELKDIEPLDNVLINNYNTIEKTERNISLQPYQAVILSTK